MKRIKSLRDDMNLMGIYYGADEDLRKMIWTSILKDNINIIER